MDALLLLLSPYFWCKEILSLILQSIFRGVQPRKGCGTSWLVSNFSIIMSIFSSESRRHINSVIALMVTGCSVRAAKASASRRWRPASSKDPLTWLERAITFLGSTTRLTPDPTNLIGVKVRFYPQGFHQLVHKASLAMAPTVRCFDVVVHHNQRVRSQEARRRKQFL